MTRRILGVAVLLLTTTFLVPGTVQGQKQGLVGPGGEIESDKLNPGTFVGILKAGVSPGADFDLEIEYKHLELNPKALQQGNRGNQSVQQAMRAQQQIAQARQQMMRARNPQEQARAMQQMQRAMQQMQQNQLRQARSNQGTNLYKVVSEKKEINFHADDDLVIRRSQPAMEFDDKGNIRSLTPENLRLMKGSNPRLPGYEGKLEDLKPGAVVQVTMRRNVVDPKNPGPIDHRNVVTMIIIEKDGQDAPTRGKKK